MAEGPGPGGPAAARHQLSRVAVRFEVFLAQAEHFLKARLIFPDCAVPGGGSKLCVQQRPEGGVAVGTTLVRQPVINETCFALLRDEAGVLQEAQVPGDARLGNAQNPGQLADIETVLDQNPQKAQPRPVRKQPKEARGALHNIYKSTYVDVHGQRACDQICSSLLAPGSGHWAN